MSMKLAVAVRITLTSMSMEALVRPPQNQPRLLSIVRRREMIITAMNMVVVGRDPADLLQDTLSTGAVEALTIITTTTARVVAGLTLAQLHVLLSTGAGTVMMLVIIATVASTLPATIAGLPTEAG